MSWAPNSAAGGVTFTIDSDVLTLPAAWCKVDNISALWFDGPHRRKMQLKPHARGQTATHTYQDPAEIPLELTLAGDVLYSGGAPASPVRGMQANVERLQAFATPSGNGTLLTASSTLTMPDATTRTANVQLELIQPELAMQWGRLTMVVHIPNGGYVAAA